MYCLHHYVIDWSKVQTLDDMKRVVAAMQISFDGNTESIKDLVRLEEILQEKPGVRITLK